MDDLPEEDTPYFSEWIKLFLDANDEERDQMLEIAKMLSKRSRRE